MCDALGTPEIAKYTNRITALACVKVRYFDLLTFSTFPCIVTEYETNRQETFCYFIFDQSADDQGSAQWRCMMHHWKEHDLSSLSVP